MLVDEQYTYCEVLPANYQTSWSYICDFEISPGKFVVVPIRSENREKVALVLSVRRCSEGDAPYPPHSTKHILRVFGENEPGELQLQKKALAAEYTKRFPSAEQARCLSIKENKLAIKNKLFKNNVGFKEINHSMNIIANILQGSELETSANIPSFFRGLIFSPDRKVVTGYKGHSGKRIKILKIPAGVELIENNALVDAKFDKLILPRELRQLGKYTLVQANGIGKDVASIDVEAENEYFTSDASGFYSIVNGKKKLERLLDTSLTVYEAPKDVVLYANEVFSHCNALRKIVLADGTETFDESIIAHWSRTAEIVVPRTVRDLRVKQATVHGYHCIEEQKIKYTIDEKNEHIFKDEDSIYQVLDDGTFKLITNYYRGKGPALIREETSIIGKGAFCGHYGLENIKWPENLREIEREAFYYSGLQSIVLPTHVRRIDSEAFAVCQDLKSVQLPAGLEYIAEDAFKHCDFLKRITADNNKKVFQYKDGIVCKTEKWRTGIESKAKRNEDIIPKLAQVLTDWIEDYSVAYRDHRGDKIRYHEDEKTINVTIAFDQYTESAIIGKERIKCAEDAEIGMPVTIMPSDSGWDVRVGERSIGTLSLHLLHPLIPFLDYVSLSNAHISSITPKSARRGGAKYALGSISFDVIENTANIKEQND